MGQAATNCLVRGSRSPGRQPGSTLIPVSGTRPCPGPGWFRGDLAPRCGWSLGGGQRGASTSRRAPGPQGFGTPSDPSPYGTERRPATVPGTWTLTQPVQSHSTNTQTPRANPTIPGPLSQGEPQGPCNSGGRPQVLDVTALDTPRCPVTKERLGPCTCLADARSGRRDCGLEDMQRRGKRTQHIKKRARRMQVMLTL